MSLRLLIDECLSPDLVDLAVAAGHVQSTCLRDRGLLGTQDWTLMKHVLAEDFTLVTVNAQDFRGSGQDAPGVRSEFRNAMTLKGLRSPTARAVADVLATARKAEGLTQRDLAARTGRPHSVIGMIETEQRQVTLPEFITLAEAIGRDPVELFISASRA